MTREDTEGIGFAYQQLSIGDALDAVDPAWRRYQARNADDPLLRDVGCLTMEYLSECRLRIETDTTEVSKVLDSGLSPVFVMAAFRAAMPYALASSRRHALSVVRDTLMIEQKRLGDPQLPVEIVVELISKDSEKALDKVLRKYR